LKQCKWIKKRKQLEYNIFCDNKLRKSIYKRTTMTIKELLLQEIESSPDVLLAETLDFLRFLKTKSVSEGVSLNLSTQKDDTSLRKSKPEAQEATPILRGSKAEDLLKFAGTWQGDDFEECLQLVYDTRSQAEF
jgi:hypothetical protein